jgi:hypothetical protein
MDIGSVADWSSNAVGLLTLVAVVFAGWYAKAAARWTKAPAESTRDQAELARIANRLAEREAADARAETAFQRRNEAERRVDALAPSVFAIAVHGAAADGPEGWPVAVAATSGPSEEWREPVDGRAYAPDEPVAFRFRATVTLRNVSDVPAIVRFADLGGGHVDAAATTYLLPGGTREVAWTRRATPAQLADAASAAQAMHLAFEAGDVGGNVRDHYRLELELRHFDREGDRVVYRVRGRAAEEHGVAVPVRRDYLRLDARPAAGGTGRAVPSG